VARLADHRVRVASRQRGWSSGRVNRREGGDSGLFQCMCGAGAAGGQIGARRLLNDAFHETLLGLNDAARIMTWSIDDGPEAVSKERVTDYVGRVQLRSVTDGDVTFVEWSSSWADSKGGAKEFCDPFYKALLASLQAHFAPK
jgi:hypothetical protein